MKILLLAMLTLGLVPLHLAAGTITYTIPANGDGVGESGTITTDGKTGILTQSDIISWSLTDYDGITLTPSNGSVAVLGTDLTATDSQLDFDFPASLSPAYFFFYEFGPPYSAFFGRNAPYAPPNGVLYSGETINLTEIEYDYSAANLIAGTSVPEPGTITLILSGLSGMGLIVAKLRRRARSVRA